MTLHLLFFAALAERLGCREETLSAPAQVRTLGDLQHWLAERGGAWAALAEPSIRMARNQTISGAAEVLEDGDEIAFFPPVTGG